MLIAGQNDQFHFAEQAPLARRLDRQAIAARPDRLEANDAVVARSLRERDFIGGIDCPAHQLDFHARRGLRFVAVEHALNGRRRPIVGNGRLRRRGVQRFQLGQHRRVGFAALFQQRPHPSTRCHAGRDHRQHGNHCDPVFHDRLLHRIEPKLPCHAHRVAEAVDDRSTGRLFIGPAPSLSGERLIQVIVQFIGDVLPQRRRFVAARGRQLSVDGVVVHAFRHTLSRRRQ